VRKPSVALLALSLATAAHAQWSVVDSQSEFSADNRVEHRHVVVRSDAGADATLDLAILSSKKATLRMIDNASQASDLAAAMEREKCVAGVNGGYFDPDFAPIGLRIVDGKITSRLTRARLLTGVLSASRQRGTELVRLGEFAAKRQFDAAVECGPFLVDGGLRVRGLDNTRVARRTFAAVGRGGQAALGVSDAVTLAGISEILASPKIIDAVTISRAMNLDGGSSTAFWFRRGDGSVFSIGEQKTVRDFVAVIAK
jgi:uncharacterized protein YigE (DUF2233 family)